MDIEYTAEVCRNMMITLKLGKGTIVPSHMDKNLSASNKDGVLRKCLCKLDIDDKKRIYVKRDSLVKLGLK